MTNIHVDTGASDDERRADLYRGDLFVFTPRCITRELCDLAHSMAAEAFHPHDPRIGSPSTGQLMVRAGRVFVAPGPSAMC